jgi:FkbH-like protein
MYVMNYVFRNNTVERFFTKDYAFSGYDDVGLIPQDYDMYVWWYQVPIKYDAEVLSKEINEYADKLSFVLNQIKTEKTVVALTMELVYAVTVTENDWKVKQAVDAYNSSLIGMVSQYPNLRIIDLQEFTRQYSASELIDWKYYFISQTVLNPKLNKSFIAWWNRKMDGLALKRKKCLVLDLDNTLWGGILGEDGVEGIQIGGDYPGKAFLYWQEGLLQLAKSGIILTVCSKNNEKDVLEAWAKNPYLVLRKEDFTAYRINWQDKAANIRGLAEELNIGLDSLVFIDDNPTERELVKQMLPMVSVPDFPAQPYMLPAFFAQIVNDYFKVYRVTDEDLKKGEQYRANVHRAQAQKSFTDYNQFLKSLEIKITVEKANDFNIPRIAQMTQKTNQFNLTTRRYTESDIRGMWVEGANIWCIRVEDKFGDNGITGCIIVKENRIDTFLLSCRVLGKGIEIAFAKAVFKELKGLGIPSVTAQYIPTVKNGQVKDFYEKCGMTLTSETAQGEKEYILSLNNAEFTISDIYTIKIE